MKKILAMLISMVLVMTTGVFADAKIPDILTTEPGNYTADYSVSFVFESSDQLVALLEELEMPEDFSYLFDMKTLLKSLLTYDGKMKLQADFSEDFSKIKLGLVMDGSQKIDVNPNLKVGYDAKTGMWMNIDLSNTDNPVFDITMSLPVMNKYLSFNASELLDEQTKELLKKMYSKEYFEVFGAKAMDIMAKYVQLEETETGYKLSMNNEGFAGFMDEYISVISAYMGDMLGVDQSIYGLLPSFKNMQLLGDNGIQCEYTVKDGVLAGATESADISIDISQIYKAVTGMEWAYASTGKLDFTVNTVCNISKIGSTVVEFPVLTEENSISIDEMMAEDMSGNTEEYEPVYPYYYAFGYCSALPVIDGDIYVPLRMTIESAYEDAAVIDYNNGVVTVSSEYFPGFKNVTMTIGTDKVYTDGAEHAVGSIMLVNDLTYVNSKLFTDIFGWELEYASYDLLSGEYSYDFYTDRKW